MSEYDILNNMDYVDAIMIVDRFGKIVYTVRYNPRFDEDGCEGDLQDIINKYFLEVYPNIDPNDSTIINCIKNGKPIYLEEQVFSDYKGRVIKTQNLTIPIIRSGTILGAVELSKDITKIQEGLNKAYGFSIPLRNRKTSSFKALYNFDDIITVNKEMLQNVERAKKISSNKSTVLIYGETGTGKELFVQSIHNYSNRRNNPFIVQNCAALPENLFESILFGSIKGSFTGAVDRSGLFEEAHGGTLFLDEINSMPFNLQAKLLRVLQDGRVRRVGDNKDKEVDVRIIAAMNVDPVKALEEGYIREDLFYRLNVVNIKLLPLIERKEDIMVYVDYFINTYNKIFNKEIIGVSKGVKDLFVSYNWPGNVRELQHVIESSMHFLENGEIKLTHLPVYLNEKIKTEGYFELDKYTVINNSNLKCHQSLDNMIELIEKQMIIEALDKSRGNISRAANLLKITRQRLHYKLDKYNIRP